MDRSYSWTLLAVKIQEDRDFYQYCLLLYPWYSMTWSAVVTGCLSFGFCCCDKLKKQLRGMKGLFGLYILITEGSHLIIEGSQAKNRAGVSGSMEESCLLTQSPCLLSSCSYTTQGVTARWWHCPPTSVINWRKCPQTCPQVSVIEVAPQLRPPFLGMFRFVFNCQKLMRILSKHSMSDQVVVAPNVTQQCQGYWSCRTVRPLSLKAYSFTQFIQEVSCISSLD